MLASSSHSLSTSEREERALPKDRFQFPHAEAAYTPVPPYPADKLIGESDAFSRVLDQIQAVRQTQQDLCIQGETGTGKSLVAHTLHWLSGEEGSWLVFVDCSVLAPDHLRPLLFGTSSPRDARDDEGLLDFAAGGTIVLDHLHRLSPEAQRRLNHLLEAHSFRGTRPFGTRLIGLSTRPLPHDSFSTDLYHRLAPAEIHLPPLRDRAGDAPRLTRYFAEKIRGRASGESAPRLSDGLIETLREWDWPGNVRQLRNVVERSLQGSDLPSRLEEDDLTLPPERTSSSSGDEASASPPTSSSPTGNGISAEAFFPEADDSVPEIEELKQEAAQRAYDHCDGDVDRAAVELGVARSTMYRMLKRYDIE